MIVLIILAQTILILFAIICFGVVLQEELQQIKKILKDK